MAKKFIIQDNTLRLGNVFRHSELKSKESDSNVIGGGYWHIDDDKTTLYLYGKSIDYGKVTIEQLKEVKENGMYSPFLKSLDWKYFDSGILFDVIEYGTIIN